MPPHSPRAATFALALVLPLALACFSGPQVQTGSALFASPQVNPLAVSPDGTHLYVANTTSGSVSVIDISNPLAPVELAEIMVGLDPVGVAVMPALVGGDERVLVTNHISDSISVISRDQMAVVQTVQELDGDGISSTDEPVGVIFAGSNRAFVSLDNLNEVLVLDVDGAGVVSVNPTRLPLTAQGPRAMAVSGNRLFVAAFESGNQTEIATCAPDDPRGLNESDPFDEGCEFPLSIVDSFDPNTLQVTLGTIFNFATGPNIGGRVIRDRDIPDRDLFVFDLSAPGFDSDPGTPGVQPESAIEGVGTLLYGLEAVGDTVYVTNTDARNHLDGLNALDNRMFDNRLSVIDCSSGCALSNVVDLDVAAGRPVPTPYGIAASGNGAVLVATAAGSDGQPSSTPGTPAGQPDLPGLITLDAAGNVLGHVQVGAIPQGVALLSGGSGAAQVAFVLNTVDSTLSAVDVSTPSSPSVASTIPVGSDPTPAAVRRGRVIFSTARASSSGTFSCESCHPNGNMDQLLWTINSALGPNDPDNNAEPRLTMPVRGLQDTLPLHWDGTLGDPIGGPNGEVGPGGSEPADCNGSNPLACFRDLSNASLSGVMCDQAGGCAAGPAGLGALTSDDRDDLAAFMASVSYPPSPKRRPDDVLSSEAVQGVSEFFTNGDGVGIGTTVLGGLVGFAPLTCADNSGGCHSLPLTGSTNSVTVGGFDAPTMRGMWDRFILFSNGVFSSQEALQLAQDCADGIPPVGGVPGDPCNSNPLGGIFLNPNYPTDAQIWDPAQGFTERGSHMATFELIFSVAYGTTGDATWEFINEMSVGLPGLTGRQLELTSASVDLAATDAALQQLIDGAEQGKVRLVARGMLGELVYDEASGDWSSAITQLMLTTEQIRQKVRDDAGEVVTLIAALPMNVAAGTKQPLLDIDPADRAAEGIGDLLLIPSPTANTASSHTLGYFHVDPAARVLLDGTECTFADGCSFALSPSGGFGGADVLVLDLPGLTVGIHVVQLLNPEGLASNELPVEVLAP